MRGKTKKLIRKLHLWLGMLSGIVVFIIAITGAIYVFSEEIKSVIYKDRRIIEVPSNQERIPVTELVKIAEAQFDNSYKFQNIIIPNFPNHTVSITFNETDEKGFGYSNYVKFNKTIYLNPYNGKVVKIEDTKWEFFNVVFWIHISLFLGYNSISSHIIIWSTCIFIVLLISGFALWWPNKKQRKHSFSFKWKKNARWRRKNYDVHRILGFYIFSIGILLACTGLMWASKSFNTTVKWIANGGKEIIEKELSKPKETKEALFPLDKILNTTVHLFPESKYILIRRHPKEQVPYIVRSYISETVNFTRIEMLFGRKTGEILDVKHYSDKNNGEKLQALNYDLHVGSIGGIPTKIIAFIASLIIASLPLTGFLIWYGKKKKSRIS